MVTQGEEVRLRGLREPLRRQPVVGDSKDVGAIVVGHDSESAQCANEEGGGISMVFCRLTMGMFLAQVPAPWQRTKIEESTLNALTARVHARTNDERHSSPC